MRIALLSDGYPPWERSGAQKVAAQLAAGYRERDPEVMVVTAVTERSAVGRASAAGVEARKLWTPKPRAVLPDLTVHTPSSSPPSGGRSTTSTRTSSTLTTPTTSRTPPCGRPRAERR